MNATQKTLIIASFLIIIFIILFLKPNCELQNRSLAIVNFESCLKDLAIEECQSRNMFYLSNQHGRGTSYYVDCYLFMEQIGEYNLPVVADDKEKGRYYMDEEVVEDTCLK